VSLNDSYPALPETVPRVRERLTALAADAGATKDQMERIRLAVSEAVTNAVVHAYGEGRGPHGESRGRIHLMAAVASDELWILVGDDGCGLQRRSNRPGIGMGLALIAKASDEFSILKRSSGGTEVRMRFRLKGAVPSGADQPRGSVASASRPASSRFSTMR
jgi:stage II sporulation protein AB (anti-sigma F factor)